MSDIFAKAQLLSWFQVTYPSRLQGYMLCETSQQLAWPVLLLSLLDSFIFTPAEERLPRGLYNLGEMCCYPTFLNLKMFHFDLSSVALRLLTSKLSYVSLAFSVSTHHAGCLSRISWSSSIVKVLKIKEALLLNSKLSCELTKLTVMIAIVEL